MDLLTTPLSGRWYRFPKEIDVDQIVDRTRTRRFHVPRSVERLTQGLCQSVPPYDGDLESDPTELAYHPENGFLRLFVREEERSVSKKSVESEADRLATSTASARLLDLPRESQNELLERSKQVLLSKAAPRVRVRQVVVTSSLLWISGKSPMTNLHGFFHPMLGDITEDIQAFGGAGFKTGMSALLIEALSGEDAHISPDCSLAEVGVSGRVVKCRSEDLAPIRSMYAAGNLNVDWACLQLHGSNGMSFISMDKDGVFRVDPISAPGGVFIERLARRFADVFEMIHRVGELTKASVEKHKVGV